MLFTQLNFLVFAALFFPLYFLLSGRLRDLFVVIASLFFYAWWDWRFVFLLLATVTIGLWTGERVHAHAGTPRARVILAASIVAQLGLLGFFKYFNFFAQSLSLMLHGLGMRADWVTLNIVLPVGISFYTFHPMSYTIDIYRGKLAPQPSWLKFAEFVTTWPVLVAGPIIRASALLPQLRTKRSFTWDNLVRGLELALIGYFLKVAVADNLALYADRVFTSPQSVNGLTLVIGVVFFAFQIYGDFAGYSLIAIGMGRIMGVDFGRNFNYPYFATSFSDFWLRWHISLSSWLRDYLYISLGGNRVGKLRTYANLMATMLLGGLWHGANWTFVIWGALHGFYLILQRVFEAPLRWIVRTARIPGPLARLLAGSIVFTLVCVAWIFFRARDTRSAVHILTHLFTADYALAGIVSLFQVMKGMILILVLLVGESLAAWPRTAVAIRQSRAIRFSAALMLLWILALAGNFDGQRFIYFAF